MTNNTERDALLKMITPHVYDGAMGGVGYDVVLEIAGEIADAVLAALISNGQETR
jgi:hypothetical protein